MIRRRLLQEETLLEVGEMMRWTVPWDWGI